MASDNHTTLACELEVGGHSTSVDLADEGAGRVPDMDTITAASIDTALGVGVNT